MFLLSCDKRNKEEAASGLHGSLLTDHPQRFVWGADVSLSSKSVHPRHRRRESARQEEEKKNPNVVLVCGQRRREPQTHVTFSSLACLWLVHTLLAAIPQEHLRGLLIKPEMPDQWHFRTFSSLRFWNTNVEKRTRTSSLRKSNSFLRVHECCSVLSPHPSLQFFFIPFHEQKRLPSF